MSVFEVLEIARLEVQAAGLGDCVENVQASEYGVSIQIKDEDRLRKAFACNSTRMSRVVRTAHRRLVSGIGITFYHNAGLHDDATSISS